MAGRNRRPESRGKGAYVVSDHVVPTEECPLDAVDRFLDLLQRYPEYVKVGFGLKLDDIPDRFGLKSSVLPWEKQFWTRPLGETGLYEAIIDTTFALYRGGGRSRSGPRSGRGRRTLPVTSRGMSTARKASMRKSAIIAKTRDPTSRRGAARCLRPG